MTGTPTITPPRTAFYNAPSAPTLPALGGRDQRTSPTPPTPHHGACARRPTPEGAGERYGPARQATSILLVAGDQGEADIVRYALAREGHSVDVVGVGREAMGRARGANIGLIILDADLSGREGVATVAALRAAAHAPLIVVARATDEDIVAAFSAGADDYVTKPFNVRVLAARVEAVLRRAQAQPVAAPEDEAVYNLEGAAFDSVRNEMTAPGARVALTPTEGRILRLLLAHRGQTLSPDVIRERIWWGHESLSDVRTIKTHIHHLREKLARLPSAGPRIRTVPGVGYSLVLPATGRRDGEGS